MGDTLLDTITRNAVNPALALLPTKMDTPAARVLMLTACLQESGLTKRAQVVDGGGQGPARGIGQFEKNGGVRGVLNHSASKDLALKVCQARGVAPEPAAVWARLEFDDVLAMAFVRLLIYTDALPLPAADDPVGSWKLYAERTWNPGKPKPDTWPGFHFRAQAFVLGRALP